MRKKAAICITYPITTMGSRPYLLVLLPNKPKIVPPVNKSDILLQCKKFLLKVITDLDFFQSHVVLKHNFFMISPCDISTDLPTISLILQYVPQNTTFTGKLHVHLNGRVL